MTLLHYVRAQISIYDVDKRKLSCKCLNLLFNSSNPAVGIEELRGVVLSNKMSLLKYVFSILLVSGVTHSQNINFTLGNNI